MKQSRKERRVASGPYRRKSRKAGSKKKEQVNMFIMLLPCHQQACVEFVVSFGHYPRTFLYNVFSVRLQHLEEFPSTPTLGCCQGT